MEHTWTPGEIAAYCRCDRETVYRWIREGQLGPVVQRIVGGPILVLDSTFRAFLAAATRTHHRLQANSSLSNARENRTEAAVGGSPHN
jgi:excisionase family DNA binding protein